MKLLCNLYNMLKTFKKVIFTDLDESLLINNSFDRDILENFIKLLMQEGYLIIAVTSKTSAEVINLFAKHNLLFPFSSENGAAYFMPSNNKKYYKRLNRNTKKSSLIKNILLKKIFKKYNEMIIFIENLSLKEQMKLTMLNKSAITNFLKREYSVPILWKGDKSLFKKFKKDLFMYNLNIVFGGKMLNISGAHNKVDALNYFSKRYESKFDNLKANSISIGDSENDVEMLNSSYYAGIVKNKYGSKIILKNKKNVFYSKQTAPEGWIEVVKKIRNKMENEHI